jgi:hypothetical protein
MFEWIGWVATAIFGASYFCTRPDHLRRVQALAALLWIGYGLVIGAAPVVAANVVVAGLAVYSSTLRRDPPARRGEPHAPVGGGSDPAPTFESRMSTRHAG